MNKVIFIVLILFGLILDQPILKYNIDTYKINDETIDFNSQLFWWYDLKELDKVKMISEMVDISDGNLKYQVIFSDLDQKDSVIREVEEEITRVEKCINDKGYAYFIHYKSDLQIGTVLLECMLQENMFDD